MCIYVYTFFLKASQRQPSLPIYVFRVNNVPHCSSRYTCNKKLTELTANRVPVNRSHGFFYRISGISSSARTNKHGMIGIDNWLQLLIGGQLANSLRAAHAAIDSHIGKGNFIRSACHFGRPRMPRSLYRIRSTDFWHATGRQI